ncbi:MAG: RNA 2',3'-cyclic phosphodiesterase [Candidatus Dormibacteria bacterium]
MRLFLALRPDEAAGAALDHLVTELAGYPALRPVRTGGVHLTVQFLGECDAGVPARLGPVLGPALFGSPPVRVRPGPMLLLPSSERPRVIALSCEPDLNLSRVSELAVEALIAAEVAFDIRPFRPHLTLARVRERSEPDARRRLAASLAGLNGDRVPAWTAHGLLLLESQLGAGGARYREVARFPFSG